MGGCLLVDTSLLLSVLLPCCMFVPCNVRFPSATERLFQATFLFFTDARDSASDADDHSRGPGGDGLLPRHEDVLRHAGARLARRPLLRRPRLPPGACASPARSLQCRQLVPFLPFLISDCFLFSFSALFF